MKGLHKILGDACFAADLSGFLHLPNDVYAFGFVKAGGERVIAAWDGRDMPDDIDGELAEGGKDCEFPAEINFPSDAAGVKVFNQNGDEIYNRQINANAPFPITLTNQVVYILLSK